MKLLLSVAPTGPSGGPFVEPRSVLAALAVLPHSVEAVPQSVDQIPAVVSAEPDAVLIDARDDLVGARAFSAALHAADPALPIVAVMDSNGLVTLPQGWAIADFVLSTAAATEVRIRLDRVARRGTVQSDDPLTAPAVPLALDAMHSSARIGRRIIPLTDVEFRLLAVLSADPDRVFSRASLVELAWAGLPEPEIASVGVQIARLRRKLGSHASMIRTVRKVGYRLEVGAPVGSKRSGGLA